MQTDLVSHFTFTIERFRDGDTVDGILCCGHCDSLTRETIRLLRIESWEPRGVHAEEAHACAHALTHAYKARTGILSTQSLARDRYARILADIILPEGSLSQLIVDAGLAWFGVGEPPPSTIGSPIAPR